MADVWQYFKKLFVESENSSPSKPFIHELIKRSESEKKAYQNWVDSDGFRDISDWIYQQYGLSQKLPEEKSSAITFLKTASTNGIAIHVKQSNFSKEVFQFLFDWLKDKVRSLNYRSQVSDVRTYQKAGKMETCERHYLKPRPDFLSEQKFNQSYGNITIELISKNDELELFKFVTTRYSDHLYKDANSFEDLMDELFKN